MPRALVTLPVRQLHADARSCADDYTRSVERTTAAPCEMGPFSDSARRPRLRLCGMFQREWGLLRTARARSAREPVVGLLVSGIPIAAMTCGERPWLLKTSQP